MKKYFNKWLVLIVSSILLLGTFNSCVKNRNDLATDFSNLQDFVIFQYGGLTNFTAANIPAGGAAPDTINLTTIITLASKNVASAPVVVTLGLDDTKRTDYNTANNLSVNSAYQAFPTNLYKILTPTVTIPAGQNYATVSLQVYARLVPDPTVSYMLPLTIKDASGKNLSSNLNTMYYHIIGNPLAGNYTWDFSRFNSSDTTPPPAASSFTGHTVSVSPSSATALLLPDSYLTSFVGSSAGVTLSFTNNSGVLSNFSVSFDPGTTSGLASGGFTILAAPVLVGYTIVGNANTRYAGSRFRTYFSLLNSTGGTRTMVDNFVKQ